MKYTHRNLDLMSSKIAKGYNKIQEYEKVENIVKHAIDGTVTIKIITKHWDWDGTSNKTSKVKIDKYTFLDVLKGLIRNERDKANKYIDDEVEYRRATKEEEK